MRSVKRDSSNFPKLKDEKQWNDWYNRTKEQARSQFVDEIFKIKYKPRSVDEINLFDLNKRCILQSLQTLSSLTKENP